MNNYFMETHHHEWILTNRRGSYALGTGNLINQRKYHGLLIASDRLFNRTHLVAGLEEKIEWRGESFFLDSNNYSNCIYPEGFLHLVKPWLRPYPAFLYSALPHQNEILILKEIMMADAANCVLVRYKNLGMHPLNIEISPKYTMSSHHQINRPGSLEHEAFSCHLDADKNSFFARREANQAKVYSYLASGELNQKRKLYHKVFYPWEVMFGYEGVGDQISLFEAFFSLKPGQTNTLLFSDTELADPQDMIEHILGRYKPYPKAMDFPQAGDDTILDHLDYEDNIIFKRKDYLKILELALTDFIANDDIIAGYPYYGAWGRDAMVVVNALLYMDGQMDLVQRILMKYSRSIKNGLIPNRAAESGFEANYDSVDASLWYIVLLWKYAKKQQNKQLWQELIHLSHGILSTIAKNNDGRYFLRADGLIEFSESFAHGSWMDVRIDGQSITPRHGAPVEINALWYNALACHLDLIEGYNAAGFNGISADAQLALLKESVKTSFQKFCGEDFLADRLEGDTPIMQIRPNAIIALSLPWQIVDKSMMRKVLERSFRELYTFYGIRSLSPKDPAFQKKYYGTQNQRDLAYHNGSAWAWLLGAFSGLYVKVYKGEKSKAEIAEALGNFICTLRSGFMRGHIASVAEVWDGDNPHFPKGAPAQAWSVAALYNIESYIESLGVES